jgi:hypothetical protein
MRTIGPSDVRRVLTDRREYLAKKKQAAYESGKPFGYESSEIAVIDWVLERVAAKDVPTEEEAGEEVRVAAALEEVSFPGYRFRVGRIAGAFLQVVYDEPDVEDGEPATQHGRKWYVSRNATRGEIVQTALKAVLTSHEHRVREHFTWRGARLFGPHFDLEQLAELARSGATEQRDLMHPTGRCTCAGDGVCAWCVDAKRREEIVEAPLSSEESVELAELQREDEVNALALLP